MPCLLERRLLLRGGDAGAGRRDYGERRRWGTRALIDEYRSTIRATAIAKSREHTHPRRIRYLRNLSPSNPAGRAQFSSVALTPTGVNPTASAFAIRFEASCLSWDSPRCVRELHRCRRGSRRSRPLHRPLHRQLRSRYVVDVVTRGDAISINMHFQWTNWLTG